MRGETATHRALPDPRLLQLLLLLPPLLVSLVYAGEPVPGVNRGAAVVDVTPRTAPAVRLYPLPGPATLQHSGTPAVAAATG